MPVQSVWNALVSVNHRKDKWEETLMKITQKFRLITQICFAALTNGYLNGYLQGTIFRGTSKKICVPGLNCYSCPGALGACPIGSLQAVLGQPGYRFSYYVIGLLMAFGAFFGRFICGWLCPFGLVQDLLYRIPFPIKIKSVPGDKYLKYLKYVVLAIFVIILPLTVANISGMGDPWFCKWICPSGTLFAGFPLVAKNDGLQAAVGFLFYWKTALLLLLLALSVLIYRPFCRYLCPLGAIYGCFNKFSLYRYVIDGSSCIKCGKCQEICDLHLPVYETPNSAECIRCGKCKSGCPKGAIRNYRAS